MGITIILCLLNGVRSQLAKPTMRRPRNLCAEQSTCRTNHSLAWPSSTRDGRNGRSTGCHSVSHSSQRKLHLSILHGLRIRLLLVSFPFPSLLQRCRSRAADHPSFSFAPASL